MVRSLLFCGLLFGSTAQACPFCDAGATETARFMLIVFGLFALAVGCLFIFAWKSGLFSASESLGGQVLKVENKGRDRHE